MVDQPPENITPHLPAPSGPAGVLADRTGLPSAREPGERAEGFDDIRRYFDAILRHKWLVLLITVLGTGAGFAAMRMAEPVFSTEATVWIETDRATERGPIREAQLLETSGWVDLLKSFVVLDEAVRELQLYVSYDGEDAALFQSFALQERFAPGRYELQVDSRGDSVSLMGVNGTVLETSAVGDSIGRAVGFAWQPEPGLLTRGREVEFSVSTPRDRARNLADNLSASVGRNSNFLRVRLSGSSPRRIAATVNTVLERFVEVAAELKRRELTERAAFLADQLDDAERNLREAERLLRDYQIRTITLPSERVFPVDPSSPVARVLEVTQDPVFGGFFGMRVEVETVRRDREEIVRGLGQAAESDLPVEAFEAIGAVQRSAEITQALVELTNKRAELRALRYRYTDAYAPVRRLREQIDHLEERAIPDLAQALVAELTAREQFLEGRLQDASSELREIPPRRIEEARLARDVNIAETLYTNLQQRFEEVRLAELSSIPDVRILDAAAVPDRPSSSRGRVFLLMGFAGGLGLGLVGALGLDRIDRRVRYPDQVTYEMGLPILGIVPHMRGVRDGRGSRDSAPVIEAVRGIRLNLVHAYGAAGPIVITVSSPGAGDGKSFVACNLALAFADAGHRTLLIDGDSRRGSLHRALGADRKPGLTDCLAGRATVDAVVQKTEYPLLHFLGGGTRVPGVAELLGSPQMVQLLTGFRSSYAVIITDSPPLGAGVDAFTLGTLTGNLIVVLRTGATNRDETEAKLDLLDRLPVRVLGAVLNGVKDQHAYGYQYYSYYMPGYDYEVEESSRLVKGAG